MSVCLSYEHRRARNFLVLAQIRKLAAFSLPLNWQSRFRWIASEANVADEPSRKFDPQYQRRLASDVCEIDAPSGFDSEEGAFIGFLPPNHGAQTRPRFGRPGAPGARPDAATGSEEAADSDPEPSRRPNAVATAGSEPAAFFRRSPRP